MTEIEQMDNLLKRLDHVALMVREMEERQKLVLDYCELLARHGNYLDRTIATRITKMLKGE